MPNQMKKLLLTIMLFIASGCSPESSGTISNLLNTLEPRPEYVLELAPLEAQTVSLIRFKSERGQPGFEADIWEDIDGYSSQICLKVRTALLAQSGDNFTQDATFKSRITMTVNDSNIQAISVTSILLEAIHLMDENNQIIMRGVEPRLVCGQVQLEPGVHNVQFQFRQTSGNILKYRWQFALE